MSSFFFVILKYSVSFFLYKTNLNDKDIEDLGLCVLCMYVCVYVCVCVCACVVLTLQESSRCCAMVVTFSTTVRSRDCAACEMNITASIGTSVTPNFLAVKETHTHTHTD